jgi:hypothetical protein
MLQALACVQLNPHAGKIEQEVTFDKVWQSDAACEDHCEPPSPDKWPNMHVSQRQLHAMLSPCLLASNALSLCL